ncbi:MAG: hypothetical protein FJ316_09500 [SAR202 cluster bacterium]|nr:hypothetical protein [SAR202 cluster bacterium]
MIPRPILERLEVPVLESWPYSLADDRVVEYDIGQTSMRINGSSRIVPVVFGEAGGPVLLGATALELFHLAVDPVRKRLMPVPGLLMKKLSLEEADRCLKSLALTTGDEATNWVREMRDARQT